MISRGPAGTAFGSGEVGLPIRLRLDALAGSLRLLLSRQEQIIERRRCAAVFGNGDGSGIQSSIEKDQVMAVKSCVGQHLGYRDGKERQKIRDELGSHGFLS